MVEETLPSSDNPAKPMRPTAADVSPSGSPSPGAASATDSAGTASSASTADKSSSDPSAHAPPIPRWLFKVLGHVLAAALGLLLGYLILRWFRPDALPW